MMRTMTYVLNMKQKGRKIKPNRKYTNKKGFKFKLIGRSDSDYRKDIETRKSITGYTIFLEGTSIAKRSKKQSCVTLSISEAEYVACTECVQEALFAMRVIESLNLQVKKPIKIQMDNKGPIDLMNTWNISG